MREPWKTALNHVLNDFAAGLPVRSPANLRVIVALPGEGSAALMRQVSNMNMEADTILPHQEFMDSPEENGFSLVALKNGRVAGQISLHLDEGADGKTINPHLDAVFVDAMQREQGIGRVLAISASMIIGKTAKMVMGLDPDEWENLSTDVTADTNAGGRAVCEILEESLAAEIMRLEDLAGIDPVI